MTDREKIVFWKTFGICSFVAALVICFFLYTEMNKDIYLNLVQNPVFPQDVEVP